MKFKNLHSDIIVLIIFLATLSSDAVAQKLDIDLNKPVQKNQLSLVDWTHNVEMGTKYIENNKLDSALIYFQFAHEIGENIFKSRDSKIQFTTYFLGFLNFEINNFQEAKKFLIESTKNEDYSYFLLGKIYENQEDYSRAEHMFIEFVKACNKKSSKYHKSYARSLSQLAMFYNRRKEFENAIPIYLKALLVVENRFGKKHLDYETILNNLGKTYADLRDYNKAINYQLEAFEIAQNRYNFTNQDYGLHLYNLGSLYNLMGKYDKAINYLIESIKITKNIKGKNNYEYCTRLNNLANAFSNIGKYDKALNYYIEVLELTKQNRGVNHPDYALSLENLGSIYTKIGQFEIALEYQQKALDIIEITKGRQSHEYANVLNKLGVIHEIIGNYNKAIGYQLEASEIFKNNLGENHPDYGNCLSNIGCTYRGINQFKISLKYLNEALKIFENTYGINHPDYGVYLNNIGLSYCNLGNYSEAFKYFNSAKIYLNVKHPKYKNYLNNFSILYRCVGNYDKALKYLNKAIEITDSNFINQDLNYGVYLNNIGLVYMDKGNYSAAIEYFNEALTTQENIIGKESLSYASTLNNLGVLYLNLGDNKKALKYLNEALTTQENIIGKGSLSYARTLNNISTCLRDLGDYGKSMSIQNEAVKITENKLGRKHPEYGVALNNLGKLYKYQGDYDKALIYFFKALKIKENLVGKEHYSYVVTLMDIGLVYNLKENYSEALNYQFQALNIFKNSLGKEHPSYDICLENIGYTHEILEHYDKALSFYLKANENTLKLTEHIFSFRSEKEKSEFLDLIDYSFDSYQSFGYLKQNQFPKLNEMNLNNHLLLKKLLLHDSRDILKKLGSISDEKIQNKIFKYRNNKAIYNYGISQKSDNIHTNLDSLKNEINNEEVELVKLFHKKFGDNKNLIKNWKELQNNLEDDEIAIEFSKFKYRNKTVWTDSNLYVAYLVKKEWSEPKMIYLFEEKQLINILSDKNPFTLYVKNKQSLYNLIWSPLEDNLKNVKTVYYSFTGLLHKVSLAAISNENQEYLCQKFNLIQLTKSNSKKKYLTDINDIVLIGGIDYSQKKSKEYEEEIEFSLINFNSNEPIASNHSRGENWDYLPGTLNEINKVKYAVGEKHKLSILSGENATEENFNKFDGNSPNVLHIATHGFFFENPVKSKRILNEKSVKYKLSEDPLLRSGLILAGGNHSWVNDGITFNKKDGILTAKEISIMDLNNTKLVILSACETGLGDINGSEGVFGLYRAFKMAGVGSIIMSLWKIPDNETVNFMEIFYGQWMSGSSIDESFRQTQLIMMELHKDEPRKWAGFILVN